MSDPSAEQRLIARLTTRFPNSGAVWKWYKTESLAGFGGFTAMELVNAGRAQDVHEYLDAVDAGVYS